MKPLRDLARDYAIACHEATNHKYGDNLPYSYHLNAVKGVAVRFKHLIPKDKLDVIYAACWCHDLIEDTRQSYNDVKSVVGEEVADIVYALTTEKGKTRKERAGEKYYSGIRGVAGATFVKLCDRIANIEHSFSENSRMLDVYREEFPTFFAELFDEQHVKMWHHIIASLHIKEVVTNLK